MDGGGELGCWAGMGETDPSHATTSRYLHTRYIYTVDISTHLQAVVYHLCDLILHVSLYFHFHACGFVFTFTFTMLTLMSDTF